VSAATDFLEQALADHFFRTATFAKPAALWIGLFTTAPADDGTGGVEVTGGGYLRRQLDPGDANWLRTGSVITNIPTVQYPTPTADWGLVIGAGLFSASTSGTLYIYGPLIPVIGDDGNTIFNGVNVLSGETSVRFDTGQLRFEWA
jgi:hypothetical protein